MPPNNDYTETVKEPVLKQVNERLSKSFTDVRHLEKSPSDIELLFHYGLYKHLTTGPNESERPTSIIDIKRKAKWDAWNMFDRLGLTSEQAEEMYVKFVADLKRRYT
mmetsp:Transcript_966/g.1483  ORF Transcript_966/g.1483 Transcript_966/m.1483 type:complete len:107 (+) Transcript_966:250-570(+)|eukprot:CAMPEP_0184643910 /NCGR_PEP_ID=MMETSP0308-20130426/724_1 /TAXON_ID=38269 /ORGANISM="Gloeochaete witrockiana, Strain SAG 46.84" /LENGTH=106 /DNA_ID=CAMNT_0027072161 /DNA_START=161 /DNA_END=481 /DNA_ORIENTATION=-